MTPRPRRGHPMGGWTPTCLSSRACTFRSRPLLGTEPDSAALLFTPLPRKGTKPDSAALPGQAACGGHRAGAPPLRGYALYKMCYYRHGLHSQPLSAQHKPLGHTLPDDRGAFAWPKRRRTRESESPGSHVVRIPIHEGARRPCPTITRAPTGCNSYR